MACFALPVTSFALPEILSLVLPISEYLLVQRRTPLSVVVGRKRRCRDFVPTGVHRFIRWIQAWPASLDNMAGVTPNSARARSYLSSRLRSKINSSLGAQL